LLGWCSLYLAHFTCIVRKETVAWPYVCSFKELMNQLMDFHEGQYEDHASRSHPIFVFLTLWLVQTNCKSVHSASWCCMQYECTCSFATFYVL
jgi:hypothetical protein